MKRDASNARSYKQTARAKAAEETGERIITAFMERLQDGWYDEIRLEDVARDAGVTVQTVIRRFGGKEGLLTACQERTGDEIVADRALPVGNVEAAIEAIIREYEKKGALVMRMLAQEERYPQIFAVAEGGRKTHRDWVGKVFAPWLDKLEGSERQFAHDRLVIALDLYVWKLIRVDMKRGKPALRRAMLEMAADALGTTPQDLLKSSTRETTDA